mgnify:CR=1 FL=1
MVEDNNEPEKEYDLVEVEMEFTCPKRGKVKEKVQVKKYKKTGGKPTVQVCH